MSQIHLNRLNLRGLTVTRVFSTFNILDHGGPGFDSDIGGGNAAASWPVSPWKDWFQLVSTVG